MFLLIYGCRPIPFHDGKGYMHGRRAPNVHLAIRTVNCRGRYCRRVNSPKKAHSYLHGRRAVIHALNYLHGSCRACKSCIWLFARQIKFAATGKRNRPTLMKEKKKRKQKVFPSQPKKSAVPVSRTKSYCYYYFLIQCM